MKPISLFKGKNQTLLSIFITFLVMLPIACDSKTSSSLIMKTDSQHTETRTTSANGWTTYDNPSGNNFSISIPNNWRKLDIDTNDLVGSLGRINDVDPYITAPLKDPNVRQGLIFYAFESDVPAPAAIKMRISNETLVNVTFDKYLTEGLDSVESNPNFEADDLAHHAVAYPFGHGEKYTYQARYKNSDIPPFRVIQYVLSDGPDFTTISFFMPLEKAQTMNTISDQIIGSFHLLQQ